MFSLIVCLILGLNIVLGEESDLRSVERIDIRDALKIASRLSNLSGLPPPWEAEGEPGTWQGAGGNWGKPGNSQGAGGNWGKPQVWGKPPMQGPPSSWPGSGGPPMPESAQNDVLGVDKMFRSAYPLPASSAISTVNMTYYEHSLCSSKSRIQELLYDGTFEFPLTCNGITTFVAPWQFNATLNGYTVVLNIPKLYITIGALNGNLINLATGAISTPAICEGSYFWDVIYYAADDQYQCSSTGLTGHTMVYTVKLITGPCMSVCWLEKGYTRISPRINNLGSLTDLGNS